MGVTALAPSAAHPCIPPPSPPTPTHPLSHPSHPVVEVVDWRAYAATRGLTDKQSKLAEKIRKRELRVQNLQRESEKIRSKQQAMEVGGWVGWGWLGVAGWRVGWLAGRLAGGLLAGCMGG